MKTHAGIWAGEEVKDVLAAEPAEPYMTVAADHGVRENLKQFIDADPCFTLRFGTSTVEVQTEDFNGVDRLRLTVTPQPQSRAVRHDRPAKS